MIEILAAGPVTSVQDLGRVEFRAMGVGVSGAMDRLSLQTGNLLVANAPGDACIETAVFPLRVRFATSVRFAVTGAPAPMRLDGAAVPSFWSRVAGSGQVLEIDPSPVGMWSYLAVAGGFDVPLVMGSRSTDLKGRYGGHGGRALTAGDRLGGRAAGATHDRRGSFGVVPPPTRSEGGVTLVRALPAREYPCFGAAAQAAFWTADWVVQPESNRIGYRLAGPVLEPLEPLNLLSHGLIPGVVQVPPAGQPMVQLSEANTCGGYPKMAVVIGADLRLLAQTRPGKRLRFVQTTQADALAAAAVDRTYLAAAAHDIGRLDRGRDVA